MATPTPSPLDCKFYTSFYPDLASLVGCTELEINEHYLTIGKAQGRVANQAELDVLVASMLRFDTDVYSSINLSFALDKTLKASFPKANWLNHYYNPQNGNLFVNNRFRVMNHNDLRMVSNRWDEIYEKIYRAVDFNLIFYRSFYEIPAGINMLQDLKRSWLENGIFAGQKPNLKALNENINVLGNIQTLLMNEYQLDMAFLGAYKNIMMDYAAKHAIVVPPALTDENSILLFLLFNTGYQLRLFFNQNEYDRHKEERIKQYNDAIAAIKAMTYKPMLDAAAKAYAVKDLQLSKVKAIVDVPIVKDEFSNIISLMNVVRLSNEDFLNCFKKISGIQDDLAAVIKLIVLHELTNCVNPELNSMEVKILVASLVYNIFIANKTDSAEYAKFVQDKSVEILTAMFKEKGLTDFETVLVQDIALVLESKKVVKMSYIKNRLMNTAGHLMFLKF